MFDKLDSIEKRFKELETQLSDPAVMQDMKKYSELMKEHATSKEIVDSYAMFERALMYDWCLCNGKYALARYSDQMMPMFLEGFRAHHKNNGKNNQKYKHISYKATIV